MTAGWLAAAVAALLAHADAAGTAVRVGPVGFSDVPRVLARPPPTVRRCAAACCC